MPHWSVQVKMDHAEFPYDEYNAYLEEFTYLPMIEADPLNAAAEPTPCDLEPKHKPEPFLLTENKAFIPTIGHSFNAESPRANGMSEFLKKKHRIRNETERLLDYVEANDLRKIRNRRISLSEKTQFVAIIL